MLFPECSKQNCFLPPPPSFITSHLGPVVAHHTILTNGAHSHNTPLKGVLYGANLAMMGPILCYHCLQSMSAIAVCYHFLQSTTIWNLIDNMSHCISCDMNLNTGKKTNK